MQRTWVRALVQEDPTCHGATKPVHHNYWAQVPRAHAPQHKKPLQWEAHTPQLEKARAQQQRPKAAKNKLINKLIKNYLVRLISGNNGFQIFAFKNTNIGLPWWRSGWESACQCRGHGFEPWSGKIPHAAERLGPWATITEPVLRNKTGCDSERPAHRDEEWPPLATTRESPRTETKTQHSHK